MQGKCFQRPYVTLPIKREGGSFLNQEMSWGILETREGMGHSLIQ